VAIPYELHLAARYLRVHRGRTFLSVITLISIAGVAVGTAALVIALALMTGFEEDMRDRILRGAAHLQLLDAGKPSFADASEIVAKVGAVPGVAGAAPVLYSPAMIMSDVGGTPVYAELQGVDPEPQSRVIDFGPESRGEPLLALTGETASGRAGIVLGADLAADLRVDKGDLVRVLVPKLRLTPFTPIPRSLVLEVVGTFKTGAFPQDKQRAYLSLDVARRLLEASEAASWVEVRLEDPRRLAAMKSEVARAMGGRFVVLDLLEQNQEILKAFNTEKLFLFLAIALIVVVAALNIVSTLVLMVNDKVREIGTLTAMGAKRRSIAVVFVLQGLVIGILGTTVGLTLGTSAAWWLDRFEVMKLNPDVYFVSHVPFSTRPQDIAVVGLAALLIALAATIYPAWKAASLEPVEAIRHE